jgi:hypothetical protein
MKKTINYFSILSLFFLLCACSFGNTQPRTVDAARQHFDQGAFIPKITTQSDVKSHLGSPSEMRKMDGGRSLWVYIKLESVSLMTVSADTGTNYSAEYLFDPKGLLLESNYKAIPANNPLIRGY